MPNWCNNTFELIAAKDKIKEFETFLETTNGKDWFDFFAPCPQELKDVGDVSFHEKPKEGLLEKYGYSDWYSFGLGEWGCKWNCDANDWNVEEYDDENDVIKFWFDSPWGPPTELYNNISNGKYGDDLTVFAEWHEEGMAFIGRFEYGDVEQYEYSDLESLDGIPDDLLDNWNLREMLEERAEWDEENLEIDLDDGVSAINEQENEVEEVPNAKKEDLNAALEELKKEFVELMKEQQNGKSS